MVGDLVLLESKPELTPWIEEKTHRRLFSPLSPCGVEKGVNIWDNKNIDLKKQNKTNLFSENQTL